MNPLQINDLKSGSLLIIVIAMQIITWVTTLLDVAVARQVTGFLYLTFIPGIVILKLLKLRDLSVAQTVVLSVGLSIAFLMFAGLLVNELCPMIGISKPLSLWPLMIIINVILILMCALGCVANKEDFSIDINVAEGSKLSRIIVFVFPPLLSIVGTIQVNVSQNNFLLLLLVIAISVLVVLGTFSDRLLPSRFYPLSLFMIAAALLFHASLASGYIYGYDINVEYYTFKLTENNSRWNSTINAGVPYDKINGMLSVTVLPTIFAGILNLSATWILKTVYPLIFSFVPVVLYQFHKERVGKKVAFVSTFFFMATSAFFMEMLMLTRQMVAELFFVLLFFVLFHDKIDPLRKRILFIIFSAALAVSHYALSYIFMFYIFSAWLSLYILEKKTGRITASMVTLLFVILFSWYIYVSTSGPFNGLLSMGDHVITSISTEFFNPEARGQDVLRGLGLERAPSSWHLLGRIFAYATEFLIVVGFVALLTRRKKRALNPEYFVLLSLSMVILILCIALPAFASTLRMSRYYHTLLIFLSPLCIQGGENLLSFFARKRIKNESCILVLVLVILVPYFLFQTGFVYEVTRVSSWSIPLSRYRMGLTPYAMGFIDEQDAFGAMWLSEKINTKRTLIYADIMSKYTVLTSYGMTKRDQIMKLSNVTTVQTNSALYLRRMNLVYGVLFMYRGNTEKVWNITEISPVLNNMNKVYSNGECEIYKATNKQTGS